MLVSKKSSGQPKPPCQNQRKGKRGHGRGPKKKQNMLEVSGLLIRGKRKRAF